MNHHRLFTSLVLWLTCYSIMTSFSVGYNLPMINEDKEQDSELLSQGILNNKSNGDVSIVDFLTYLRHYIPNNVGYQINNLINSHESTTGSNTRSINSLQRYSWTLAEQTSIEDRFLPLQQSSDFSNVRFFPEYQTVIFDSRPQGLHSIIEQSSPQDVLQLIAPAKISVHTQFPSSGTVSFKEYINYSTELGSDLIRFQTNVAVLDTGIDASHATFRNKILWEQDFTTLGANGSTQPILTDGSLDLNGHGTTIASLIAGRPVISNYVYPLTFSDKFEVDPYIINFSKEFDSIPIKLTVVWNDTQKLDYAVTVNITAAGSDEVVYSNQGTLFTQDGAYSTAIDLPSGAYQLKLFNSVGSSDIFQFQLELPYNEDLVIENQFNLDFVENNFYGYSAHSSILSLKVLSADGTGELDSILEAVSWIKSNYDKFNISIVNLSFSFDATYPVLNAALDELAGFGLFVVTSIGNSAGGTAEDTTTLHSPASALGSLAIGAIDNPLLSNRSIDFTKKVYLLPGGYGMNPTWPNVLTPIYSSYSNDLLVSDIFQEDSMTYVAGTSVSAAIFSGSLAHLISYLKVNSLWSYNLNDLSFIERLLQLMQVPLVTGRALTNFSLAKALYQDELITNTPIYLDLSKLSSRRSQSAFSWSLAYDFVQDVEMQFVIPYPSNISVVNLDAKAIDDLRIFSANYSSGDSIKVSLDSSLFHSENNYGLIILPRTRLNEFPDHISTPLSVTMSIKRNPKLVITYPTSVFAVPSSFPIMFEATSNNVELWIDGVSNRIIYSGSVIQLNHGVHIIELRLQVDAVIVIDQLSIMVDAIPPQIYDLDSSIPPSINQITSILFSTSEAISNIDLYLNSTLASNIVQLTSSTSFIMNPHLLLPGAYNASFIFYDAVNNSVSFTRSILFTASTYLHTLDRSDLEIDKITDREVTVQISLKAFSLLPDRLLIIHNTQAILISEWTGVDITVDLSPLVYGLNTYRLILNTTLGLTLEIGYSIFLLDVKVPSIQILNDATLANLALDITHDHRFSFLIKDVQEFTTTVSRGPEEIIFEISFVTFDLDFTLMGTQELYSTSEVIEILVVDQFFNVNILDFNFLWDDLSSPIIENIMYPIYDQGDLFRRTINWNEKYPTLVHIDFNGYILFKTDTPTNQSKIITIRSLPAGDNFLKVNVVDVAGNSDTQVFLIKVIASPEQVNTRATPLQYLEIWLISVYFIRRKVTAT